MERGSHDVVTCAQEDSATIEESCPPMDSRLLGTGGLLATGALLCSVYVSSIFGIFHVNSLFLASKLVRETLSQKGHR